MEKWNEGTLGLENIFPIWAFIPSFQYAVIPE
jgi:hypothetical protein